MKVSVILWILVAQTMLKQHNTKAWRHFKSKDGLSGFNCDPVDFAFVLNTKTDKTRCVLTCINVESCVSLFYKPSTLQCFGCKLTYGVDELTEKLPGSLYYEILTDVITTTFGTSHYFSGPTGQTFEEAVVYCQRKNAHLVQAETLEENRHLKKFFKRQPLSGYEIWHGMTDIEEEGLWRWNNSGKPLTGFNDWAKDAPKNITSQNCGKFTEGRNRKWTGYKCTNTDTFTMCEESLEP